jgi:hypothetical protein
MQGLIDCQLASLYPMFAVFPGNIGMAGLVYKSLQPISLQSITPHCGQVGLFYIYAAPFNVWFAWLTVWTALKYVKPMANYSLRFLNLNIFYCFK